MSAEPDLQPSPGTAAPQLQVLYVTMQFPVPSEAFAAVELRALRRAGAAVSVEALRPRPADAAAAPSESGLAELPLGHNSLAASLRGVVAGLRRPRVLLDLIAELFRHGRAKPGHLVRSLLLAPRILDLFARVARDEPDVLHLFWGHYPSLLGLLVERHLPSTLVSLFLGAYDLEQGYGGSGALARRAPVVWTHAEVNRLAIERLGVEPKRIEVCHRGVEPIGKDAGRRPKAARRILVAERLIAGKHTDDALRAFALVHRDYPTASLVVLGDGPERQTLERLARELAIADQVSFAGHVSQEALFAQMAEAEVMLAMSRHPSERLPNAVKEAMLRRCVCVVARSLGIEELLSDGVEGFIVAPGDVEAAAARMADIFTDPERAGSLGQRAHGKIAEHFDVDRLTRHRLAIWRDLLSRAPEEVRAR